MIRYGSTDSNGRRWVLVDGAMIGRVWPHPHLAGRWQAKLVGRPAPGQSFPSRLRAAQWLQVAVTARVVKP